jgi:hypothetical protein
MIQWDAPHPVMFDIDLYRHISDGQLIDWIGPVASWPGFERTSTLNPIPTTSVGWQETVYGVAATRYLSLKLDSRGDHPFAFLDQSNSSLSTQYEEPVLPNTLPRGGLSLPWGPEEPVMSESSQLVTFRDRRIPADTSIRLGHRISHFQVQVDLSYYWLVFGSQIGNPTYSLHAWDSVTIKGLTSEPFSVRSPWALTYSPGHHNAYEHFIIEPRLDPEIPAYILEELELAGIDLISVNRESYPRGNTVHTAAIGSEFEDIGTFIFGELSPNTENILYGSDGYISPWFGTFKHYLYPWIEHTSMGWVYVLGPDPQNFWLQTVSGPEGWLWTSEDIYPFHFQQSSGNWFFHYGLNTESNWWYNFTSQSWIQYPEL